MFPIPETFPASIRIYCNLATILMQKITSLKRVISLVIKRISTGKRRQLKTFVEAVTAMAREANSRMTATSGSTTRTKIVEV